MTQGWYGKLPALGDFASRRLTPLFVEPWDLWLATGLASWRDSDDSWLESYLLAPTCRFALGVGVPFPESPGYAGVLMPSVDRVGRYFPLTVVRSRGLTEDRTPAAWLQAVERIAITALHDEWSAERFDAELDGLDEEFDDGQDWPASGQTVWWCERDGRSSEPIAAAGLPDNEVLIGLLAGRL